MSKCTHNSEAQFHPHCYLIRLSELQRSVTDRNEYIMQLEGAVAQKEGDVASLNDQVSWPIHQPPKPTARHCTFSPFWWQLKEEKSALRDSIRRLNDQVEQLTAHKEESHQSAQDKEAQVTSLLDEMQLLRADNQSRCQQLADQLQAARQESQQMQADWFAIHYLKVFDLHPAK